MSPDGERKVLQTQVDPDSHQEWQQVSVTAWTTDQDFINTLAPIWEYSDQMLQSTCSACHSTPPTTRYTANGWIAGLKAMSTYYRLNPGGGTYVVEIPPDPRQRCV